MADACKVPAQGIQYAIVTALEAGYRTPDIGGNARTCELSNAVIAALRS